jgi:hypothetical protein
MLARYLEFANDEQNPQMQWSVALVNIDWERNEFKFEVATYSENRIPSLKSVSTLSFWIEQMFGLIMG